MPRQPVGKVAKTAVERMREKRARDRGLVWGADDSAITALSESGLFEQLALAFRKESRGRKTRSRWAITRGLIKEIERRMEA